jgi:hypothetical protein
MISKLASFSRGRNIVEWSHVPMKSSLPTEISLVSDSQRTMQGRLLSNCQPGMR